MLTKIYAQPHFLKLKGKRNLSRPSEYVPVAFKYQEIKIETGVRGYLVVPVHTGCPKKMLFSGILAITPLWKGLELKVGGVSKTSGNSLSDRHKNFPNLHFKS